MNWEDIWNNRKIEIESDVLTTLFKADGYDSGAGLMTKEIMNTYSMYIINSMGIRPGNSVFEIGCGAGALLYSMSHNGILINGCDYSEALIKIVNQFLNGTFYVSHANSFCTDVMYDYVFSAGVFHYFHTYDYAIDVVKRMLCISKNSIAVFDIPDLEKKDESESKRRKADENYDIKYNELRHLYYDKTWWLNLANELGCDMHIEDQCMKRYENSKFRYNVFMTKKDL